MGDWGFVGNSVPGRTGDWGGEKSAAAPELCCAMASCNCRVPVRRQAHLKLEYKPRAKLGWDFNHLWISTCVTDYLQLLLSFGKRINRGGLTAISLLACAPGLSQERVKQLCLALLGSTLGSEEHPAAGGSPVEAGEAPTAGRGPQACRVTTKLQAHKEFPHTEEKCPYTPSVKQSRLKHHCETFVFF